MRSIIIFKKTAKQTRIEKVYNLPEGITINRIADITFKNVEIERMFQEVGYYQMICILNKEGSKTLADVKMTTSIKDVKELIKQLDKG